MTDSTQKLPPLLRIGFRPFFLGAALWAIFSMLIWMSSRFGLSGHFIGHLEIPAYLWHGHEMVFGFVAAVIAGFLLTASSNWTGFNPASGLFLGFLVFCWGGSRICFYAGSLYPASILDLGFDFGLLIAVARVILKARLYRNLIVIFLLSLPVFLNLDFYLIEIFRLPFDPALPIDGALAVFFMFLLVIAGRIIPVFSPNAISELQIQPAPLLNKLSLIFGAISLLLWSLSAYLFSPFTLLFCAFLFLTTSVLHFKRFLNWKPWLAIKNGMIFVLYLSYLWVILSFLLMGLEAYGLVLRSMTIHVMGLGAISTAIAAMICRVTRGHTGRKILIGGAELIFFYMISLAAILRLISASQTIMGHQELFLNLLMASATCFIAGFGAFLWRYSPFLCRNRADGKKG